MLESYPLVVLLPAVAILLFNRDQLGFLAVTMAASAGEDSNKVPTRCLLRNPIQYSTNEDCCRPFTPCFGFGLCPCLDWLQGTCATFVSALLVFSEADATIIDEEC